MCGEIGSPAFVDFSSRLSSLADGPGAVGIGAAGVACVIGGSGTGAGCDCVDGKVELAGFTPGVDNGEAQPASNMNNAAVTPPKTSRLLRVAQQES